MKAHPLFSEERLRELCRRISEVRVGLVGDLCLDLYWKADMTRSELSRETPHYPLPIVKESYSLGAGGNAAANLAALKPRAVLVAGLLGRDWRGGLAKEELARLGIDGRFVVESENWVTNAYCKPFRKGISQVEYEDPRLDFANYLPVPAEEEEALLDAVSRMAEEVDVLCVSDQFLFGCVTGRIRNLLSKLAKEGLTVVADSRYRIEAFAGCLLKPNEVEGCAALGRPVPEKSAERFAEVAAGLAEKTGGRVCMTIGELGCLLAGEEGVTYLPGFPARPPINICGAGDSFLSGFSAALAAGAEEWEAAVMGSLAAAVTVKCLEGTGTASLEEMKARFHEERERGD